MGRLGCTREQTKRAKQKAMLTQAIPALAFLPRLNAALIRIISYERDENGNLVSDGTLGVSREQTKRAKQKAMLTQAMQVAEPLKSLSVYLKNNLTSKNQYYHKPLSQKVLGPPLNRDFPYPLLQTPAVKVRISPLIYIQSCRYSI